MRCEVIWAVLQAPRNGKQILLLVFSARYTKEQFEVWQLRTTAKPIHIMKHWNGGLAKLRDFEQQVATTPKSCHFGDVRLTFKFSSEFSVNSKSFKRNCGIHVTFILKRHEQP